MAAVRGSLAALVLFMCVARISGALQSVLGDTASCHRVCEGTYPLHTYPEEEELFSCHRGCRLFSICQFVGDGDDMNRTKLECESACTEAYPTPMSSLPVTWAVTVRCLLRRRDRKELTAMMPRIHVLFPLTLVRSFWSDMADSAQSFITSYWTFYMQVDDGRIVVFQSEPEVQQVPQLLVENPPPRDGMLDKMSSDLMAGESTGEGPWSHKAGLFEEEGGDGLMKCFSMNSNWLLTATLLLSVIVLLWICCATVATAVDQYIPSEKLSIYGDLEHMDQQKLHRYSPAALVVVHGKYHENEDAGPLPAKVDLTRSSI